MNGSNTSKVELIEKELPHSREGILILDFYAEFAVNVLSIIPYGIFSEFSGLIYLALCFYWIDEIQIIIIQYNFPKKCAIRCSQKPVNS